MRPKIWAFALASAASLALVPALAQKSPESILPPGFGGPPVPPPAAPSAAPTPAPSQAPDSMAAATGLENASDAIAVDEGDNTLDNADEADLTPIDLPPQARRSTERVGLLAEADGGLGAAAFGTSDGRFLIGLMQRIDVPIASRWTAILLRRALLSRSDTPSNIAPADWIAERALLLARLGDADDARALVAAVDADNYTPRMYDAAMQAALASADPAALCGVADAAVNQTRLPGWALARAICQGLGGEGATANAEFDELRRSGRAGGVDVRLAEKVAAVGGGARRSISIAWDGVDQLNAWRFGMAAATAVPIPTALQASVGPQVQAWLARAPLYPLADRMAAADRAASLGVFSSSALVDFYGATYDALDSDERTGTPSQALRQAYAAPDMPGRVSAMQSLWDGGGGWSGRYARLILTARAAGALPPGDAITGAALDDAIASMLSAGLDIQAARWGERVQAGSLGWALLAVGAPRPPFDIDTGKVDGFGNAAFLSAGLSALGRLPTPQTLTAQDAWTQALDRAVVAHEPGTVALLAAVGMQTPRWAGVPAARLYRIVAALRAVGLEPEARMIAAEALTRTA
ncbi:Antifreeze glycopeptide polyprotein [Sphingomonas antarctica]|uniref:hypothetical protein n=1 Tax=Sphingomonas antarctica TaxID=2040274 RepID=UPI0039E90F8F